MNQKAGQRPEVALRYRILFVIWNVFPPGPLFSSSALNEWHLTDTQREPHCEGYSGVSGLERVQCILMDIVHLPNLLLLNVEERHSRQVWMWASLAWEYFKKGI